MTSGGIGMSVKALDLFQAYAQNKLPKEGGYIVSSFLNETSTYSIFEVVAYSSLKSLYLSAEGLTFQSDGNKLYVLVEPPTFPKKFIEPFRRDSIEKIPHRFSELDIITSKDQSKIMVSKEPIYTYGSFTILRPTGINFSFIFYMLDDVMDSLKLFFEKTLNEEVKITKADARKATTSIVKGIKKFTLV
jgi:hypothetical protein